MILFDTDLTTRQEDKSKKISNQQKWNCVKMALAEELKKRVKKIDVITLN